MSRLKNDIKVRMEGLSFFYRDRCVLKDINQTFYRNSIAAIIGPSGAGKTTLLTTINRLWEEMGGGRVNGSIKIWFDEPSPSEIDIYYSNYPVTKLRKKVGMVFQTPNPLPVSIYKNMTFPFRLDGKNVDCEEVLFMVERALKKAYLWEEVKDRLHKNALDLSVGQQQRLCLARAIVRVPEILLLDEPTSALDNIAASEIEELILALKRSMTIVMVSHHTDQVQRISDQVFRLEGGRLLS